jgi:tetratricopeptide (TPR) repeat protein
MFTVLVAVSIAAGALLDAQQVSAPEPLTALSANRGMPQGSPAEQRIAAIRRRLDKEPARADSWSELAIALARRARETGNPDYYDEAWKASETSLRVAPGNHEGRKAQVWILLGQHEYRRAVELAEQINRAVPDDVLVYGFLSDGYVELGRYDEAETAVQWMLDMRPGNVPGLTRAAHLRELFGEHEGAVEFMDTAFRRTPDNEVEDRAWIMTQIAHLSLLTCRTEAADRILGEALKLFPEYHYALAQQRELRWQQGRVDEAVAAARRHVAAAPHPENRFELGVALHRTGRLDEATSIWQQFEADARAEMDNWDNANIELITYYADYAGRPHDALMVARKQSARQKDVRTLEALAWALHRNGQSREAAIEMKKALDVGIRQPVTFYRAGVIAAAAGAPGEAKRYLDSSVAMCGTSIVADAARDALRDLTTVANK